MDTVIEELYQAIHDKVSAFGYIEQFEMLNELSRRLQEDACNSLKMEYMISETELDGINDE